MDQYADETTAPFAVILDSDEVRRVLAALHADTPAAGRDNVRAMLNRRLNRARRARATVRAGLGACGMHHG